jgi:CDP-2,3-bis-(O-geranylgeranyl)-sn-glycerol synthase
VIEAICILVLIGSANTAPLLLKRMLRERAAWPLDGGLAFFDGEPIFGRSKTVRGVLIGVIAPALLAPLLGHPATHGVAIGVGAMAGDLLSSFVKRRLKRPPSSQAPGLDQIPEVLLPLLVARNWFELSLLEVGAVLVAFVVLQMLLSKLFYRLRLREEPY